MPGYGLGYSSLVRRSSGPSVPAFSFLLDTYSGSSAAYSVARRLSSTYTGSLIRVRRSSDNAEQNIGYTAGNLLDEAALTSFVGAGNGFVTTWYDQSGNGNNATQSTAANQPQIVSSGAIVKTSGNITSMSCFNKNLSNTQANTATQATFVASECLSTGNDLTFSVPFAVLQTGSFSNYFGAIASDSNVSSANSLFGSPSYFLNNSSIGTTRDNVYDAYAINNETIFSIIDGGNTVSNRFLQYANSGFSGNYKVFEVIIYNTGQSSNRAGINTNINTFYSIY
jgi:hypothetical protein